MAVPFASSERQRLLAEGPPEMLKAATSYIPPMAGEKMTSHRARIPGPAVLASRRRELLLEEECALRRREREVSRVNARQGERVV